MTHHRRVTIRDVARQAGLSPGTVSRALSGRDGSTLVNPSTRRQVRKMAREMGYPFERLRSRPPRVKRVGIFAGQLALYREAVLVLSDLLGRHGFFTLIHSAERAEACRLAREWYRQHEVDALIFVGDRHHLDDVAVGDVPCVFVGEAPEQAPVWRVEACNEAGGRALGEHLWSLGHRRVGFIGVADNLASQKRLAGLRSVWRQRGEALPDDWVLELGQTWREDVPKRLPRLLLAAQDRGQSLTALFGWNDATALEACRLLQDSGVRIPEDMSVVGFDDIDPGGFCRPALTTVRWPSEKAAALVMQLLMERLHAKDQPPKLQPSVYELVVRESAAPPRGEVISGQ
jgi:DNA-binding LacI/PurR family transcriptional regulator